MSASLTTPANATNSTQLLLARQLCAAHGHNGQRFEQHKAALETLVNATCHYSANLVGCLPMQDEARRARLTQAVSTLLVGYATQVYLGITPPPILTEVLPQIWRLYRESGKPVLES